MGMHKLYPEGYWYGDYSEKKYKEYKFWHDGLGSYLTFGLSRTAINEDIANAKNKAYMTAYDLDYEDIVDPTAFYQADSTNVAMLNFVSSNLKRLYR